MVKYHLEGCYGTQQNTVTENWYRRLEPSKRCSKCDRRIGINAHYLPDSTRMRYIKFMNRLHKTGYSPKYEGQTISILDLLTKLIDLYERE